LTQLPYAQLIQFDVRSRGGRGGRHPGIVEVPVQELVSNDEEPPAASLIREKLGRGQTGPVLEETERSFENTALSHVQVALQHAFALQRLGTLVNTRDRSLLNWQNEQHWAEMVEAHGTAVGGELRALDAQLGLLSQERATPNLLAAKTISSPEQYVQMADRLLHSIEHAQQVALKLFAQGDSMESTQHAGELLESLHTALPIADAQAVSDFTARLQADRPRH
jgi:hypothetical protein